MSGEKNLSFAEAAEKILLTRGGQMHYRDITETAVKAGLITTEGKTPEATMAAVISRALSKGGAQSVFYRGHNPGFYGAKTKGSHVLVAEPGFFKRTAKKKVFQIKGNLRQKISSRRKGDLAENRVAELVSLYGGEFGLNIYRPFTDDEGVDFIVQKSGSDKVVFVQVKSNFKFGKDEPLVVTMERQKLFVSPRSVVVFVYYDQTEGDLHDILFCVPSRELVELTGMDRKGRGVFSVSMKKPEDSKKFGTYMVEKRSLADELRRHIDQEF